MYKHVRLLNKFNTDWLTFVGKKNCDCYKVSQVKYSNTSNSKVDTAVVLVRLGP